MSLESMQMRLNYYGGLTLQDRLKKDKAKSMLSATTASYQAADFSKYPDFKVRHRGLFNPKTYNGDYDTKTISVPFSANFKSGDVFKWEDTDTLWIVYLWDRTEVAYFRGECRRCDYIVQWVNEDRKKLETPISVRGPSTGDIGSQVMENSYIDVPKPNIQVLVTDNEQNRKYFNRYQTFILKGVSYRIQQVDKLSMPGILAMSAKEYYGNKIEDDIEQDISNAWNIHPIIPETGTEYFIEGPDVVKPLAEVEFTSLSKNGTWFIEEAERNTKGVYPTTFIETTPNSVIVKWTAMTSGSYTLCYRVSSKIYKRHILVESLF